MWKWKLMFKIYINETKYIKYKEWRRMINLICKLLSEIVYKCKKLIQNNDKCSLFIDGYYKS